MVMPNRINSSDILTSEQLDNHIKVYAGPGAGKTHFLVENIKNIVSTYPTVANSRNRKVLCITYTNAAVNEIKHRLNRYSSSVDVYTIHGFIIEHIIKPFQDDLKKKINEDFGIQVKKKGAITSQIEGVGILHGIEKSEIYNYINIMTDDSTELSYSKKILGEVEIDIDVFSKQNKIELRASSQISIKHIKPIKQFIWSNVRKLTHDEILYFGYRILQSNHTALYATRVKFPLIFVDEFQDTNPLQTLLIKLIGEKSTVIGTIGDTAQSIYSFQGAKPSQFLLLNIGGSRNNVQYFISGNRRSTQNIVNFCNFLRGEDKTIVQKSEKNYKSEEIKMITEEKKIHIISGENTSAKEIIKSSINDSAVILTRTWAAAFSYIQDINEEQERSLKLIYNAYYSSPIDIRNDIIEHSYVTWVRAFRFIFMIWNGYQTGAISELISAFALLSNINEKNISPKALMQFKNITNEVFNDITDESLTVDIINRFNSLLGNGSYEDLKLILEDPKFTVNVFDEEDRDDIRLNVSLLNWNTSYKLFTEVFSENSRYMTVHQAKGREWEKVIVCLEPNSRSNRDAITLYEMFSNPKLLEEGNAQEFTRMYYVACSRAMEDLYIHIKDNATLKSLQVALDNYNAANEINLKIEYEILSL